VDKAYLKNNCETEEGVGLKQVTGVGPKRADIAFEALLSKRAQSDLNLVSIEVIS
jgi:hypothetical protein